ncbi:hypothetical protein Tcan_01697, partial [Toxocara canis]
MLQRRAEFREQTEQEISNGQQMIRRAKSTYQFTYISATNCSESLFLEKLHNVDELLLVCMDSDFVLLVCLSPTLIDCGCFELACFRFYEILFTSKIPYVDVYVLLCRYEVQFSRMRAQQREISLRRERRSHGTVKSHRDQIHS